MQYTWNGDDGSYADPANWTPGDVPLYGSGTTALIQSGTVTLSDAAPNGIIITLAGASRDAPANLVLDNAALGAAVSIGMTLPIVDGKLPGASFATLTVEGYDTSEATIFVGAGRGPGPQAMVIAIAPDSQLNQEGTIDVTLGTLRVERTGQAPATLNNDGTINLTGSGVFISADVTGTGSIMLRPYPTGSGLVEFGGAVAETQHVAFNPYTSGGIRIDDPSAFHGVIDGYSGSPDGSPGSFYKVTLANTQATGTLFEQVTPEAGSLLVFHGEEVVASLTVSGAHGANSFGFYSNPDGSTTLT